MKKIFGVLSLSAALTLLAACADGSSDGSTATAEKAGGSSPGAGGAGPGYDGSGTGSGKYGTVPDGTSTNQSTFSATNTAHPGPTATPAVPATPQPQ